MRSDSSEFPNWLMSIFHKNMTKIDSRILRFPALGLIVILSLQAQAGEKAEQCAADPIFQQQDFALGSWDVYDAGKKVAEARLEKALGGCAIRQTWTVIKGRTDNGLGLFAYSRLLKSWGYFWVSDTGWTTTFTGGTLQSPGTMLYITEAPLKDGGRRLRHWSLILQSDGAIQERAVGTDDGKTWTTEYELLWRRKGRNRNL